MKKILLLAIIVFVFSPSCVFADFWNKLRDRVTDQVLPDNSNQGQEQAADTSQAGDNSQPAQNISQPRGTMVLQCGCNGNVQIGTTRQSNVCASGVEQAILCNGKCKGGGRQWASVCQ